MHGAVPHLHRPDRRDQSVKLSKESRFALAGKACSASAKWLQEIWFKRLDDLGTGNTLPKSGVRQDYPLVFPLAFANSISLSLKRLVGSRLNAGAVAEA